MNIYLVVFLTLVAAMFTSFSQLLFKKTLTKKLKNIKEILGLLKNRNIIIGLCGYATGFALYIIALSKSQLSVIYPIFASSFIFVTIISAVILKEKIRPIRVIGTLLVFLGIVLVTYTI
jgi:undecaprenyl phosphate-alpha-L-ara4N flippase subunit ArnE